MVAVGFASMLLLVGPAGPVDSGHGPGNQDRSHDRSHDRLGMLEPGGGAVAASLLGVMPRGAAPGPKPAARAGAGRGQDAPVCAPPAPRASVVDGAAAEAGAAGVPSVSSVASVSSGLSVASGPTAPTSQVGRAGAADEVSPLGQRAAGLYISGMRARYLGAERIVSSLRYARLNAAVIDLKDGEGQVTYPTRIPELQSQVVRYIEDPRALTDALRRSGKYSIARIVCFNDPHLPKRLPGRAVLDARPGHEGEVWANWRGRNTWLDPYNEDNHSMIVALAREAEALGFDEVQLDYFRFPVDGAASFAHYPAEDGRPRSQVLSGLLARIDAAVSIPLGVDVFGVTAFRHRDNAELGQDLEAFLPHVEVLSPMLYLKGMQTLVSRRKDERARRAIRYAMKQMRARLGDRVVLRPFLQAFPQGADYFTPGFIAEQVRGVARGGGDGYLFWHPNSDYKMVEAGLRGPVRRMAPFPVAERRMARLLALGVRASGGGGGVVPVGVGLVGAGR